MKFITFIGSILLLYSHALQASESKLFDTPTELLVEKNIDKTNIIHLLTTPILHNQIKTLAAQVAMQNTKKLTTQQAVSFYSILQQDKKLQSRIDSLTYPSNYYHYVLFTHAQQLAKHQPPSKELVERLFAKELVTLSDEDLYKVSATMGWSLPMGQDYMQQLFKGYQQHTKLNLDQAIQLVSNYQLYRVYAAVLPAVVPLIKQQEDKRYIVETDILINTPDGAQISALVVRKRGDSKPRPSALQFTIYADQKWEIKQAMHAAAHGYIGISANTRGKAKSPDKIVPWEHDGKDANAVIDWVAKQPFSDERVVMYGGSYNGFTQWAAAKYAHPALKTIVPYEAAHPFVGLPVENNIFITPNYQWAFHVTNNKTMDHSVYSDWRHWHSTYEELFSSGRAFNQIDKIEGTPNPWFQKWLSHPSYDSYYQAMLPYKHEYASITIPVLSITGYFDASISAAYFFQQHTLFNKNADHTFLIGPYNHRTAQGIPDSYHSNYKLDPVALQKDTQELTFEWFDHLLFGKAKPALLKDKINYQLMDSNSWQHAKSLSELNNSSTTFSLGSKVGDDGYYRLTPKTQNAHEFILQTIDLVDRTTQHNVRDWQVIQDKLNESNGLVFISQPFVQDQQLAGFITGYFNLAINKKDVDIGFKLFEVKSDGSTFALNRYISRASYANDMSQRQLLTPNQKTSVPIINSTLMAKLINKGSRLALVLNVNKNTGAQVNMGTGKDVSTETIADAGEPLKIKWFSDSKIKIPLKNWSQTN
ncbi:CocE/NonD family hydrolase [Paraglaciecola aestuariivivens]